jgi:ribosomal-protein-alanine N-acetyltransferase
MTELETPRLRMRPFDWNDFDRAVAIYADPDVTRFLPRGPVPRDEVVARVERVLTHFSAHWTDHGFGVWALIDRATGILVGQCGLQHLPNDGDVEVLYLLERAQWARGLATEAAGAALAHGFTRVGLDRIVAVTRPEHVASRRVMEKLGMRLEGEVDVYGLRAVRYALSRAEFLSR